MKEEEKVAQIDCPYIDRLTGNLVLQVMSEEKSYSSHTWYERRDIVEESLKDLLEESLPEGADKAEKLIQILEGKGTAFQYTPEYYAAIKDRKERIKAYKDLKVLSTVPYGEDAEIETDPFKFLYLPPEATFAQVRDAWIRLSKKWYPDLIYPENKEQFERIFNELKSLPKGTDYSIWAKNIKTSIQEILQVHELEKLSPEEKEEYEKKHRAHREKEIEYERVKEEMRLLATQKMQIINKAYAAAKKRFSKEQVESLAGFEWRRESLYGLSGRYRSDYDVIDLEGPGQLRKHRGSWTETAQVFFSSDNHNVSLAFDHGDVYLADQHEYRQGLPLKEFFAWTELKQGKGLCPTLLDDIVKIYKLDDDLAEQLRIMILNHEEPEFILTTLKITMEDNKHFKMLNFIEFLYGGPTYYHQTGPRTERYFPLGVEFSPDGKLILKYEAQEEQVSFFFDITDKREDQFSPQDLMMMRAIAYGPLLQEPK